MADAMIWLTNGMVRCSIRPDLLEKLKEGDEWHLVRIRQIDGTPWQQETLGENSPANPQKAVGDN